MTAFNKLEAMGTFVAIVETGGISAAANRQNLAKSAISRRLSDIETHLGVQLMVRTTRRQTLTDSGKAYYEQCRRLLNDINEVESAVAARTRQLEGKLRIAAPLTFGLRHLSPAICDFMEEHPGIQFDIDLNDRRIDLINDGIDVALRIGKLEDSSLMARRLAPINLIVAASPAYLEKHGQPETPQDLQKHQILHYSNLPSSSWQYIDSNGNESSVALPVATACNNGDMLRFIAEAGHGIFVQPTFSLDESIQNGGLVPILTGYRWQPANMYAVYPATRHLSIRVRAFIDFLAERFAGQPSWDKNLTGISKL